ncbi:MAG: hypothetical protein CMJ68_02675 [Planctomycetaceae bacterium]|nr:hypothetical protein [Planctomycetaceae bacterium]
MPSGYSYRLPGNSRSRRRLLVLRAAAELEEKQARRLARAAEAASGDQTRPVVEEPVAVQATESVGAAVPELAGQLAGQIAEHGIEPDPANDESSGLDTLFPQQQTTDGPDADEVSTIRELVAGPRPATWVFCGDGPDETAFPDLFAAELRTTYRRPLDAVVNTLVPGSPIETVLENLEWQLARFQPDVVQLVIGRAAASAGSEFSTTLAQLIDQLRNLNAAIVIHAPDASGSDELAKPVEQIRELASSRAIPVIDHADSDSDHDRVNRLCQELNLQRPGD